MRELSELIELLDWTNNSDYNYLISKKDAYLTHPDDDTFYELQAWLPPYTRMQSSHSPVMRLRSMSCT